MHAPATGQLLMVDSVTFHSWRLSVTGTDPPVRGPDLPKALSDDPFSAEAFYESSS
ncbi:MAG TPA: hypothetical protein PLF40_08490 [Kofleriaceae bacterium]|nr:hypothetical protein [Kofleriaceae bacterium]